MGRLRGRYYLSTVEPGLDLSILSETRYPRLLTVQEAALVTRRPVGTIYRRISEG